MSDTIGSPGQSCQCWAPVLGTMLILIGIFDLGFGTALAAATIELGALAGEIEASSSLISIGHAFSQITGGLLQFGSADEASIVRNLMGDLPPVWISVLFAVGHILLSLSAIVLGIGLVKRMRRVIKPLNRWAWIACGWGILSMIFSIGVYQFIHRATGGAAASVTVLLDLSVHIVWPLAVLYRRRIS